MKKSFIIGVFLMSVLSYAQTKEVVTLNTGKNITVTINNIINNKGKVYFALYSNSDDFRNRNSKMSVNSEVVKGKVQVVFKDVDAGEYAIVCFHDSNDNGRMDFQENGMPLEDYGASNNVMSFGPPNFNDAKFQLLESDLNLEIKF